MRLPAAFVVAATLSGIAAASLSQWVGTAWLPQVGLLAVAAWAFRRGGSGSVLAAWVLGWCFDALSAAPAGTHAFLYVVAWMATRFASFQVQLRSGSAFALYMLGLSLALTLVSAGTLGRPVLGAEMVGLALVHALVNAAAAAPYRWLLWKCLDRFEEGEPIRGGSLGSGVTVP